MKRLSSALFSFLLVTALAVPARGGTGRYVDADPDTLELKVMFLYDEQDPEDWEETFEEASKLLYNATEQQVRIGKVTFFVNCPDAGDIADVKIQLGQDGARAHTGGMTRRGTRILLSQAHETVTTSGAGDRGQFGLVHELGHYTFGLKDEYENKQSQKTSDAYCVDESGTTASIMDGGTTVDPNNRRTEFCWADNHRTGKTEQDKARRIGSTTYEDTDSWTWLAAFVKSRYGADLDVPTADPGDDASGHGAEPTFEYVDCGFRAVVCVDRSGSMGTAAATRATDGEPGSLPLLLKRTLPQSLAPIDLAKQGAGSFVELLDSPDRAAVTSFADTPRVDSAIGEMTPAQKAVARAAIAGISAGGLTNIGGGLQTSLQQITGDGDPVATEVIVLLSDGLHNTGTDPDTVLPALEQRGVVVHTVGLGNADAALMSRIARRTGGTFLFASTAAEIKTHFIDLLRSARSQALLGSEEGELAAADDDRHGLFIDPLASAHQLDLILTWTDPSVEVDLSLVKPDGSVLAPGDPGLQIDYEPDLALKRFSVTQPQKGTWEVEILNTNSATVQYALQVISPDREGKVGAFAEQEVVEFPLPLRINAFVLRGDAVAGAQVEATIERPGRPPVHLTLFDDGALEHADATADDGMYSNVFHGFTGDGSYTVSVSADTAGGFTAVEEEDGDEHVSEPVERFVRKTSFSAVLTGMNAADFDLDGVSDSEEDLAPGFGDGNADGIIDSSQATVASVPEATSGEYVTLELSGGGCQQMSGVHSPASPIQELPTAESPVALLGFFVECASAVVELRPGGGQSAAGLEVLRFGPTPGDPTYRWYDFSFDGSTGAQILGDRIVLHLEDGFRGDDDLTANGVVAVGQLAIVSAQGDSVLEIPVLDRWGVLLLALLLGAAGLVGIRGR